jgi:hypothetical protein
MLLGRYEISFDVAGSQEGNAGANIQYGPVSFIYASSPWSCLNDMGYDIFSIKSVVKQQKGYAPRVLGRSSTGSVRTLPNSIKSGRV